MTHYKSDFLNVLHERGFIHQMTDATALDDMAAKDSVTCYIGFDCTGPSLHVGSMVQIMLLRWAQKTGHKPIALMGGGTTRIGDPSGKEETRQLLDDAAIDRNLTSLRKIFDRFLRFGNGQTDALMVNNEDWLSGLEYIPFLRGVGKHFTINRMLTFESVKQRLEREQPLTFLEFNYMILQAYDFAELAKRYDCRLQMGGSDQWGNIVNGIELARRKDGRELYGLTTPLITTADGSKMGKTARGAIWLNEDMLPAYDFYQFWRNTADSDVGPFLRLFTELPLDEIARLEALEGAEINEAKKTLAYEATKIARGKDAAEQAQQTAIETFGQQGRSAGLPTIDVSLSDLEAGIGVLDLFIDAGLATSRKEVRRLIAQGGARLNDMPISDEMLKVDQSMLDDGVIKLSAGKKRHALVKPA